MVTYIHHNVCNWGVKDTIVIADGRALCELSIDNDDMENAWLTDVIVWEPARGNGLGRELLQLAERHAREMGAKAILLWADVKGWPIDWYKRHGFVECDKIQDGLIVMKKDLAGCE